MRIRWFFVVLGLALACAKKTPPTYAHAAFVKKQWAPVSPASTQGEPGNLGFGTLIDVVPAQATNGKVPVLRDGVVAGWISADDITDTAPSEELAFAYVQDALIGANFDLAQGWLRVLVPLFTELAPPLLEAVVQRDLPALDLTVPTRAVWLAESDGEGLRIVRKRKMAVIAVVDPPGIPGDGPCAYPAFTKAIETLLGDPVKGRAELIGLSLRCREPRLAVQAARYDAAGAPPRTRVDVTPVAGCRGDVLRATLVDVEDMLVNRTKHACLVGADLDPPCDPCSVPNVAELEGNEDPEAFAQGAADAYEESRALDEAWRRESAVHERFMTRFRKRFPDPPQTLVRVENVTARALTTPKNLWFYSRSVAWEGYCNEVHQTYGAPTLTRLPAIKVPARSAIELWLPSSAYASTEQGTIEAESEAAATERLDAEHERTEWESATLIDAPNCTCCGC